MNKNIDIYVKFQLDKITGIFEKFSQHGEGGGSSQNLSYHKNSPSITLKRGVPKRGVNHLGKVPK